MQERQYFPVNWTDGMKINKSHFITQDNAVMYQIAENTGSLLNEYNYGLLPAPGKSGPEVKMFLSVDNQQQVQLRINQCRAITRGGNYIHLEEDRSLNANNLGAAFVELSVPFEELNGKGSVFYIVISINPYQHVPFGLADLTELPTRLPYSRPSFDLSLVPEQGKNLLGLYQLPVGRLKIEAERVLLDEEYIPPCSAVSGHYELLEIHGRLEQFYARMEMYALQIIQKILQKKQTNEMAGIVQKLCENVTHFTASQLAEIKTLTYHQPPVYLFNKVCSLARLVKNTLDYYTGSGKEEFINYCTEWCSTTQGELEGTITALTNHLYNHLDVRASIDKLSDFTKVFAGLLSNLARLDYIGKRKDAGIFVKEELVSTESEEPRKRRSFLAD